MASAIQAVNDKYKRLDELWKSNQLQQLLTVGYTDDATIVEGNGTYKGHAELLKLFQKFVSNYGSVDHTVVDTTVICDDTVELTTKGTEDGKVVHIKMTWRKVGDNWKISSEQVF